MQNKTPVCRVCGAPMVNLDAMLPSIELEEQKALGLTLFGCLNFDCDVQPDIYLPRDKNHD